LQADDGIAASIGQPLRGRDENALQAVRQKGDAEKLFGGGVIALGVAIVHRIEVGGKLRLFGAVFDHVLMR
jgi:hypothetical protein